MKRSVLLTLLVIASCSAKYIRVNLPRLLKITVDGNLVDVCVDGQRVAQTDLPNHNTVQLVDTIRIPNRASVLAVKANDGNSNFLGLVAADSTGSFVSNTSWRCHVNAGAQSENWCSSTLRLDWPPAFTVAKYGADNRSEIAGPMPAGAEWIWTSPEIPNNDGVIYCQTTIPASSNRTQQQLPPAPVIVRGSEKTLTRIVGEPVTVYAIATGPAEQSDWTKDAVVVSTDPAIHISAVTVADAGTYESTFSNTAGSATHSTTLDVLVPPKLSGTTSERHVLNVGDAMLFGNVAVIGGTQPVSVTWYFNGVLVTACVGNSATPDNAGTYTVIAENAAGLDVHYVVVDIVPGPMVIGPYSPADVTRHSGTSVTLFCVVYGGDRCDKPTVSWTKNGAAFSANDGGVVFIQSASAADAGVYTCTYTDTASRTASKTITLTVVDAPVISPPFVENHTVYGGEQLCLSCPLLRGTDPVSRTWYRRTQQLPVNTTCLEAVDYIDIARFTCLQSNDLGDDVKIDYVTMSVMSYSLYNTSFVNTNATVPGHVAMQVKAIGQLEVALTSSPGDYTDYVIIVTLGAEGNTIVTISERVNKKSAQVLTSSAPLAGGVLSETELRWFWVSVSSGVVSVGQGPAAGQPAGLLVQYTVDAAHMSLNALGLAVTQGSSAAVLVYPQRPSGSTGTTGITGSTETTGTTTEANTTLD